MTVLKRVVKPVTRKGKKVLIRKEPQLVEPKKQVLFIRGRKTSDTLMDCMREMHALKKPDSTLLGKKNDIVPFENCVPIETFCKKLNGSLFVFGSSNKKRPNNLILGRTFHHQILDMIELGIENFTSMKAFDCDKIAVGLKPCIIFSGEKFDSSPEYKRLKNLLVDLFQREAIESICLQGIEHVLMFTADEDKIFMRSYRILLKKSATHTPRIELDEIGPSIDFKLRRTKIASDDLFKTACRRPKELKVKKVKNISRDVFGTHARIHVSKQNIRSLQIKKMKGLKVKKTKKSKVVNKVPAAEPQNTNVTS